MSLIALKTEGLTLPERNVDYIVQRYDKETGNAYWNVCTTGMKTYREREEPSQHLITPASPGTELWSVYEPDDDLPIPYHQIDRAPIQGWSISVGVVSGARVSAEPLSVVKLSDRASSSDGEYCEYQFYIVVDVTNRLAWPLSEAVAYSTSDIQGLLAAEAQTRKWKSTKFDLSGSVFACDSVNAA